MSYIDASITITSIVAICAVVSPIFTALINNRYLIKMKKMELRQQTYENTVLHERQAYEFYLKNAGRCICHPDNDARKDYGESFYAALLFAPLDLHDSMIAIDNAIAISDMENASSLLKELTPKIHAVLQTK